MDYKKYSLEQLDNWMHDAMSAGEATPQEIYDVIIKVVRDEYYTYKKKASESYELLALLNGNGGWKVEDVLKEREYYEGWDSSTTSNLVCDKDDTSPECQKSWNDFWEDSMPPWGHSDMEALRYTEEELNAMCDKAASDEEKNKCREYNLREAEYYDKRAKLDADYELIKAAGGYDYTPLPTKDKVVKWILPVQQGYIDGVNEYYIEFPDDLLEAANLKEGDQVKWVDKGDGSYLLHKV